MQPLFVFVFVFLLQMYCNDFIEQFLNQYPDQNWDEIKTNMHKVIKEAFEIACSNPPPKGIANFDQCRAMYGIDMMLQWQVNKKGL